jgi:hypothetical protein
MYRNYGDVNFFECGILVDDEHSDTEFNILYCRPYDDEEDMYEFGDCQVDITDSFIQKDIVMNYIGMTEETFDPVQYAIGCLDYYGIENFGAMSYAYDFMHMTKKEICDILKHRSIGSDNLNIEW